VKPSALPDKWNLPALFFMSTVLGGVACISSLLLLYTALDSWNPDVSEDDYQSELATRD
jgi:H+-transporting ATPase